MPRQYSRPFIVSRNPAASATYALILKCVSSGGADGLDEAWFQRFIFEHAEILPVDEIEPVFAPLVPLCRELPTSAGPLTRCSARRRDFSRWSSASSGRTPRPGVKWVGQILDYVKDISRWGYYTSNTPSGVPGVESLFSQLSGVDAELDDTLYGRG